jgi:predicted DNA-binding protein with PD1-like motif
VRTHAVRLTPGTDLRDALERLAEAQGLRAGCVVTCVGSLSAARLRMPGAPGEAEAFKEFAEPMEVLSLAGTLSPDGVHLHIGLSRRDGSVVGGHLVRGCIVHTTAELVLGELPDVDFRRTADPATGYAELSVQPRGAPEG